MMHLRCLFFQIKVELGSSYTVSWFIDPSLAMASATSFPATLQWDDVQTNKKSH
jgi:hypothetical protein